MCTNMYLKLCVDAVHKNMNIIELVHDVLAFCVSLFVFEVSPAPSPVILSCCFTGAGMGWFEFPT